MAATTPLWRWSSLAGHGECSAATEYVPAPLAIQKRLLVCQKGKGGGGRRAASGPRCAAARPCWLADREDEGRATYREGPSQTGAAAGCRGMGAGRHLAGLRARPAYTLLYLQSLLYLNLNPGRRRRLLQPCGLSRRPGLVGETLRQARKRRVVSGRSQVVIRGCKPASLARVVLLCHAAMAQPAC